MKILVMGLPGAGKTWLSERLSKHLECAWFNADKVREMANDWDFSPEGRIRQANRMRSLADFEKANGRTVICDFVCPTVQARESFEADLTIFIDTLKEGRFEDTNKMFQRPDHADHIVDRHLSDEEIEGLANGLKQKINT